MVDGQPLSELFRGLFDDASMFPPESHSLPEACGTYLRHRWSAYSEMVGAFVCQASRLGALDELARQRGGDRLPVSIVVPGGLADVATALEAARPAPHLALRAIEIPLGQNLLRKALSTLAPLVADGYAVYLDAGTAALTEATVHELAPSGIGLKLRLGATSISAFQPESELARVLVLCAAERLAFTCSAGLHHAVRHRDADTFLDHHGYLNLALAARVAGSTGNVAATRAMLADTDAFSIADQTRRLQPADVRAVRAMLRSVATFNVIDSVRDLTRLGLGSAP